MSQIFGFLAEGLKFIMIFCDKITGHNFILALLLFTLAIKLVLFPFGIKQQKNQQKAAKLRPKELAIKSKYKGRTDQPSQQKMQQELMDMYQKENYNQFSGCLPLLIQMPILFSLYYIIQNPLHYICRFGEAQIEVISETFHRLTNYAYSTSYANITIKTTGYLSNKENLQTLINNLPTDGSVPTGAVNIAGDTITNYADFRLDLIERLESTAFPNFNVFGIFDLSVTPSEQIWWYILVPVCVFLFYFLTTKLQKKFTYQPAAAANQGGSMKMMEYMMPALSAVFTFSVPSAMGVYWIFQNLFSFLQQVALSKLFPIPKMTEEEIKAAEREERKAAAMAKKEEEAKKKETKSLFHIDDDYVAEPRKPQADDNWTEPMGPKPQPKEEKKKKGIVSGRLKEDRKNTESSGDKDEKNS